MLCIKLVNYWDKYTEMHGQKNVKIKEMTTDQTEQTACTEPTYGLKLLIETLRE